MKQLLVALRWVSKQIPDRYEPTLLASLAVLIGVIVMRAVVDRALVALPFESKEEQLRWRVAVRNLAIVGLFAALTVIWAHELQSLLLSFVALGAAAVLAFREMILSASGAFVRAASSLAKVGDRIEVQGFRGDVIDHGLFTTTLREVGPGPKSHQWTGRSLVVPNSWFLLHPIASEALDDPFLLHQFVVAIDRKDDWAAAERDLLDAANAACADYLDQAKAHFEAIARRRGVWAPSGDPRVLLNASDPTRIELLLRLPVRTQQRGATEQRVVREFLSAQGRRRDPQPPKNDPVISGEPGSSENTVSVASSGVASSGA